MLNVQRLIQSFEEIIGWPYKSPGSNDQNGIDCSGAFVRAYRAQGASIYHGSNTIFRQYCSETGRIAGVSSLAPGMAVFKNRLDGDEPGKFQGDGLGNFYHIGLVVSVNPLRIIHATSPVAKVDTSLFDSKGKLIWHNWGRLAAVAYDADTQETIVENGGGNVTGVLYVAEVVAEGKDPVKLRASASTAEKLYWPVPQGNRVDVLEETNAVWARVRWNGKTGYMMRSFLVDVESVPDAPNSPVTGNDTVTITLPKTVVQAVFDAIKGVL